MNNEQSGPLSGLRVVEFAGIGPVPFAAMLLADMGADVVRITRPERRRSTASTSSSAGGGWCGRSQVARRRRGGARAARPGRRAPRGLPPRRHGALGVGPEGGAAPKYGLVYGRMTGWGQVGPLARRRPRHRLHRVHRRTARDRRAGRRRCRR